MDTPRKGHGIKHFSTMDKIKSPNFIPPINIMRLESLKEDNLYTGDKPLEFILVPKCPLFRDSTVVIILQIMYIYILQNTVVKSENWSFEEVISYYNSVVFGWE